MTFQSGSAKVNINPDPSILSLALAGYGAPYEGRFSLRWENTGEDCNLLSLTSSGDTLYALNPSGHLLQGVLTQADIVWQVIGYTPSLKLLTIVAGRLVALDTDGNLLQIDQETAQSTEIPLSADWQFQAIVGVGNNLYGMDTCNRLYSSQPFSLPDRWALIWEGLSVQNLTSDGNRIYALDLSQAIWYTEVDKINWLKIARKNDYSIDQTIRQVFHFKGAFYAVSDDGKLLKSAHSLKYDLYATAVAIHDQEKTVVIVGVDCTGFDYEFIQEVKSAVTSKTGIPAAAVLINASHTHFAPVTQNWHTWQEFYQKPDQQYLRNYVKKGIVEAICSAISKMVPVNISFIRGTTAIGYNRRIDVHATALHDNSLDVIRITDHKYQLKQIIYLAACHPVFKNADENSPFTLSSNFPGVCRQLVADRHQTEVLFLQGFAGDVNPVDADYEQTGSKLYAELNALLNQDGELLDGKISYSFEEFEVVLECLKPEEVQEFYQSNKLEADKLALLEQPVSPIGQFALTPLMERRKNLRWVALMEGKYPDQQFNATMPVYVQVINIGKWKLLGLSREVVSDYAAPLRALWPHQSVSLAAYCNDVGSYLPCDWHIEQKTYEGYDSFYWYGSPGIPGIDVKNEVIEQIQRRNINNEKPNQ